MIKKLFCAAALALLITPTLHAQSFSVAYFPFNNAFSVTSNPERLFMVDLRLETNTFFGNINPEILALFNVKRAERINIYTGLGLKAVFIDGFNEQDVIGGYAVTFGARFKPFDKFEDLQFLFELSPYLNSALESGTLRAYVGISYRFKKRN